MKELGHLVTLPVVEEYSRKKVCISARWLVEFRAIKWQDGHSNWFQSWSRAKDAMVTGGSGPSRYASEWCTTPGCAHHCASAALRLWWLSAYPGKGASFTARFLPPAAQGLCCLVCDTPADGRAGQGYPSPNPAAHAGNLHPSRAWQPLCTAPGALPGAENETNLQAYVGDSGSNILSSVPSLRSPAFQPALFVQCCGRSLGSHMCFLVWCMIVHASSRPGAPPALFSENQACQSTCTC